MGIQTSRANQPLQGKLIAFFHQSSDMYGSDKILLYLAEAVQQQGGRAVVLLPDNGPLTAALKDNGIEYHTLPILKLSRARLSLKGIVGLVGELRRALPAYDAVFGSRKIDLVYSNTIAVLGGALWAKCRGVPHLWHVHEIIEHPRIAARIFPWLVKVAADQVVCNSEATYRWLWGAQAGLEKKMQVIWNGVHSPSVEASTVAAFRKTFHPASSTMAIGLIGRINRWKGHGLLLDAVELLYAKGVQNFSVVFIGSPPPGQEFFETELRDRVALSPLHERIVIQSFIREIGPAYVALDIVCVPSTEPEPFGLVAIEAMSAGRPVVASRFGGLTEIVVDGETGLCFTPRDVEALARTLERLLNDQALREKLGDGGKARFIKEFSVARMVERVTSIVEELSMR